MIVPLGAEQPAGEEQASVSELSRGRETGPSGPIDNVAAPLTWSTAADSVARKRSQLTDRRDRGVQRRAAVLLQAPGGLIANGPNWPRGPFG
jgi:hypothetical protein